jgi:predicted dehydrogenase
MIETKRTIRWGIIGCGDVCEVKSGPGFAKAENSALVAVMRRDSDKARDFAQRHGVPRWYDDAQQLIDDPEVDAVYVATPPSSHEEYAVRVALSGKPVYVEKPMACTHQQCQRMIEAAQVAQTPLFVAYYRRALPRFLKVREILQSGGIGEVRAVTCQHHQRALIDLRDGNSMDAAKLPWRVRPEIAGAGLFLDLASHTLDLLDFLLGPIESVKSTAANQAGLYPAEDIVTGHWQHRSGVLGTGVWCFSAGHNFERNELIGSQGHLVFSTFGQEPIEWHSQNGLQTFEIAHPPHIQQPLIQAIVDELNGKGTSPSKGESAARTSWVMDQFLESYRRDKK